MDFVALAKALGGHDGEIVERPHEVESAVARGVEYVLQQGKSYILDMRTIGLKTQPPTDDAGAASAPTAAATTDETTTAQVLARYAGQPPLDVFHNQAPAENAVLRADAPKDSSATPANLPAVF
jgi:benzoylformate decarboxylase